MSKFVSAFFQKILLFINFPGWIKIDNFTPKIDKCSQIFYLQNAKKLQIWLSNGQFDSKHANLAQYTNCTKNVQTIKNLGRKGPQICKFSKNFLKKSLTQKLHC